jgi:hypothetical protein
LVAWVSGCLKPCVLWCVRLCLARLDRAVGCLLSFVVVICRGI